MMNLSARRARMKKFSSVIVKLELISRDRQTRGGGGGYLESRISLFTRSSMSDAFSPGSGIYRYIRTIYMHV